MPFPFKLPPDSEPIIEKGICKAMLFIPLLLALLVVILAIIKPWGG